MEPVLIRELISISDQNLGLDLFDAIWPIPGGGREIPENLMQAFVQTVLILSEHLVEMKFSEQLLVSSESMVEHIYIHICRR